MSLDSAEAAPHAEPGIDRFAIWGTSAVLGVTHPDALDAARAILDERLSVTEQAASRFRPGTEILALNERSGEGPIVVSAALFDLVIHAIAAAEMTDGACDPTVADSLLALGYDRDFDELDSVTAPLSDTAHVAPAPGVAGIVVDPLSSTVDLPLGVHLDLGATAKARTADLAATAISEQLGVGALVDLGGDLRIAGEPPQGGWHIGIADEARTGDIDEVHEVFMMSGGAVASSSNAVRHWRRGDSELHHVIDPATGWPAEAVFRLATVAAPTCVEANALSTAALVWGEDALFELPQRSMAARLVRVDGSVERVGGWPEPIKENAAS